MTHNILRIDASARSAGSITRDLGDEIIAQLGVASVVTRDLATSLPHIDEVWVGANFTPVEARSDEQHQKLALSDSLVAEIKNADTLVIGLPVYNFGVPASFKTWIDLIARAGVSFQYTETGPQGLLTGKRAIVAIASGAMALGSDADFVTGYVKLVLGFIGITDVTIVDAGQAGIDASAAISRAKSSIKALAKAA